MTESFKESKIKVVREKGEKEAYAIVSSDHGKYLVDNERAIDLIKVDGKWYIENKYF